MSIFGLFGKKNIGGGAPKEKPKPIPRLEGRGEKPDTLKPNVDEGTKPVTVKIPDDILKLITDLSVKKQGLLGQFLNLSAQVVTEKAKIRKVEKVQKETLEHVKEIDKNIQQKMKYAYGELGLNKKTDYRWAYDGKGGFAGTPKPKKTEKK